MLVRFTTDDSTGAAGFTAHYAATQQVAGRMGAIVPFKACSGTGSHWGEDYHNALMGQTQRACNNACQADMSCVGTSFGVAGKAYDGTCVLCTTSALEDRGAVAQRDWMWTPKDFGTTAAASTTASAALSTTAAASWRPPGQTRRRATRALARSTARSGSTLLPHLTSSAAAHASNPPWRRLTLKMARYRVYLPDI